MIDGKGGRLKLEEPKQSVTFSKLIDRERFYKEKALKMERNYLFAKEQIIAMEARIRDLNEHKKEQVRQNRAQSDDNLLVELREKIDTLNKDLDETKRTHEIREAELLEEIEAFKGSSPGLTSGSTPSNYKEKIEGYERLLNEIQDTINQKDRELLILRKRIDTLEKKLKHRDFNSQLETSTFFKQEDVTHTTEQKAISYIDHAVILNKESCILRGDCVIENNGDVALDTPIICFRISPIDAVKVKGKIQSLESGGDALFGEEDWQWSFIESDWSIEAKERGEIWMAPTQPVTLHPNEEIRLSDVQFLIDQTFCKQLTIECFIYFERTQVRIKSVNSIVINF